MHIFVFVLLYFETEVRIVALAGLELRRKTGSPQTHKYYPCLCLLNARIKGVYHLKCVLMYWGGSQKVQDLYIFFAGWWWLRRQRPANFWVWGHLGLQSEFQDIHGTQRNPALQPQKKVYIFPLYVDRLNWKPQCIILYYLCVNKFSWSSRNGSVVKKTCLRTWGGDPSTCLTSGLWSCTCSPGVALRRGWKWGSASPEKHKPKFQERLP